MKTHVLGLVHDVCRVKHKGMTSGHCLCVEPGHKLSLRQDMSWVCVWLPFVSSSSSGVDMGTSCLQTRAALCQNKVLSDVLCEQSGLILGSGCHL